MGQLGLFDAYRRLAVLSERGDPLEAIALLVPWKSFRADIEAVVSTPEETKKSKAGRKQGARRARPRLISILRAAMREGGALVSSSVDPEARSFCGRLLARTEGFLLCGSHPLEHRQASNVVGEVLQAELKAGPDNSDRAHEAAARRRLLRTEHMFDARTNASCQKILISEPLRPRNT